MYLKIITSVALDISKNFLALESLKESIDTLTDYYLVYFLIYDIVLYFT